MAVLYLKYVEKKLPFPIHGLLCIVGYMFWSMLVIVTVPFMAVFRIFKFVEKSLIYQRNLGTVFSTLDLPFLHETKSNRNFVVGMLEVEGKPDIKKIRRWVLSRLFNKDRCLPESYKRLSQKVSRTYFSYVWTDEENFNIKRHIPVYKGVQPETKEDLERTFSIFADLPLSSDMSPWMFNIIPKSDASGYALFVKIHHVIGDGFSMIGILSQLVDKKPEFIRITNQRKGFMSDPIRRVVTGVATGPLALLALVLSLSFTNPFKALKTPGKKVVSWTLPISLTLVKKIKSATDTTVNDVLLSCLAGAVRNYLMKTNSAHPVDLPIAMTFNQRSAKQKSTQQIPLGNHSGGLFLSLPIATADPIKRLDIIKTRINKLKTLSHPHLFSFIYFNIIGGLPEVFGRLSTYSLKRHVTLICSNVPGPTETLHILNNPVKSVVFSPPLHADMGLAVSLFSYNNTVRMTIMSGEHILTDPRRLTEAFESEVLLLGERILMDD